MSDYTKKPITHKDLVNALLLIDEALDQLGASDSSEQSGSEDEVVITSDGDTVTLNFRGRVMKFHKDKSSRTEAK